MSCLPATVPPSEKCTNTQLAADDLWLVALAPFYSLVQCIVTASASNDSWSTSKAIVAHCGVPFDRGLHCTYRTFLKCLYRLFHVLSKLTWVTHQNLSLNFLLWSVTEVILAI